MLIIRQHFYLNLSFHKSFSPLSAVLSGIPARCSIFPAPTIDMKSAILLFSAGATASLTRKHNICLLQLNAFGGCAGPVGQIPDGQCRVGGGLPQSLFQLDKSRGILTDGVGRGCYITPEASQLQCDDGRPGMAARFVLTLLVN